MYLLVNPEDYSLRELLLGQVPPEAVLETCADEKIASARAAKLVEASVSRTPVMDMWRKSVRPYQRRNGRRLRRILVLDGSGEERPRLFKSELSGNKYKAHVLCNEYPNCANPREPFMSPYGKGSQPTQMCAACRAAKGKSQKFKEMMAARNRSRAKIPLEDKPVGLDTH